MQKHLTVAERFAQGGTPILVADALLAWGNCMAGNKPPESFGRVLVECGELTGVSQLPDALSDWAANYTADHTKE
jgi:hypothetical protein